MYQTSFRVHEASANDTPFMQTIILLVHRIQLLRRFHLPLGRIRQNLRTLPKVHLLSCHGLCALQPLLPVLGVPSLSATIAVEGSNLVDPPYRDRRHSHLHLPLLLHVALPDHTNLALKSHVCAGQPLGHVPTARTDHAVTLGHEHSGSRCGGDFRAEAVADDNGH